ncbi:MAG: ANTAR domain-containing protein [Hyphomonadaceae bacterium]|nr:ANTAR domain-containing protein [Hyphomonadaceae bacterium]
MHTPPEIPLDQRALSDKTVLVADPTEVRRQVLVSGLDAVRAVFVIDRLEPGIIINQAQKSAADLVILGADRPADDFARAFETIVNALTLPVVIFVDSASSTAVGQYVRKGASAFVVAGLAPDRIALICEAALERYRILSALQKEVIESKNALSARKTIERAKGLLMEQQGLREADAYETMRRLAMTQGRTVLDIAKTVIGLAGTARSYRDQN